MPAEGPHTSGDRPGAVASLGDVEGIGVGHWSDPEARTGCTVVLLPEGTVTSGEVRGGAPATREFALLAPGNLVDHVDAVLLTGGSAFGLAAADGVVRWLEDRGEGFPTVAGPVPIVVAMALFDLAVGDPRARPGPDEGRDAARQADLDRLEAAEVRDRAEPEPGADGAGDGADGGAVDGTAGAVAPVATSLGAVGAGTGATVGKWRGASGARPGGLGVATCRSGGLVVSALVAVNAFGDVGPGASGGGGTFRPLQHGFANTTIGVVATNARLDKSEVHLIAQGAHDGLARAILPAHTRVDGDAVVAAATGSLAGEVPVDLVRHLGVMAVEAAVLAAVR